MSIATLKRMILASLLNRRNGWIFLTTWERAETFIVVLLQLYTFEYAGHAIRITI